MRREMGDKMIRRDFVKTAENGYLHIPVRAGFPENDYYVAVLVDGIFQNEFLIGISAPGERCDFYVALDMTRYSGSQIALICKDKGVSDTLFEGIVQGGTIEETPELYPDLYEEEIRQQIHFSAKRGWLNDPNGLFYQDGVFHMYFQHNPFDNHPNSTNKSWGHAVSEDMVHFSEHGDPIMPRNSKAMCASGSALVDQYNIAGLGEKTVLAAYSSRESIQYHGRPKDTGEIVGQMLLYSLDGGMTFQYFDNNPIIPVAADLHWRDPKLLQLDEKTMCIAVYETYEGRNCVSFYQSADCIKWEFRSRIMDLYECPDLFPLPVEETGEQLWVLYGADSKYRVGKFEDFEFKPIDGQEGWLDYGKNVYAGQTFSNYPAENYRIYLAWFNEYRQDWFYHEDEPFQHFGFAQCVTLATKLSLHKTSQGYRVYRTPIENLESLRDAGREITITGEYKMPLPSEMLFTLDDRESVSVLVDGCGFHYNGVNGVLTSTTGKEYTFCRDKGKELPVRIFYDTGAVEMFVGEEIALSYRLEPGKDILQIEGSEAVNAVVYYLKSIWKQIESLY